MTDDELNRHLRGILDVDRTTSFAAARDRLRLAVDAAVREDRERAARIADEQARYYCECREQMRSTELARNFFGGGQEASEKIAAAIRGDAS